MKLNLFSVEVPKNLNEAFKINKKKEVRQKKWHLPVREDADPRLASHKTRRKL